MDIFFQHVRRMFPEASEECSFAEWWVHTRPHNSGHQLHFDSDDEGVKRGVSGQALHPHCSTVLCLDENVGVQH